MSRDLLFKCAMCSTVSSKLLDGAVIMLTFLIITVIIIITIQTCLHVQVVDNGDDSSAAEGTESPAVTQCVDLDDGLQDSLCKLWDMSMNAVSCVCVLLINSNSMLMCVLCRMHRLDTLSVW